MPALLRRFIPTPVHSVSANNLFPNLPKLDKVDVREPPRKDRLRELRELRGSLKSGNLTPEHILGRMVLRPNLTMLQAVEFAEKEQKLIVPNIIHDVVLTQTSAEYSTWTGTLIIYERPNQPFGKSVTFQGLPFEVPESLRGKVNCAIVIEHPDFTFVKTGENTYEVKLTEGAVVNLVENFPKENGWYAQDEFGIPYGGSKAGSPEKRRLWRAGSGYVGLLVRYDYYYNYRGQDVVAGYRASGRFGVEFVE